MSPLDAIRTGLRAIAANRMRSILTTLGLVIGVSSVIALIAVGQGAQQGVRDQISGLGTDLIFVRPGEQQGAAQGPAGAGIGTASTLVTSDADAILASGIPGISAVAPQIRSDQQIIAGSRNTAATIVMTTPEYIEVRDIGVESGSFITPFDVGDSNFVAVLGAGLAETLFVDQSPLGESVRLSLANGRISFDFEVVGVMAERGGAEGGNVDNELFIPVTAIASRLAFLRNPAGGVRVNQIDVQAEPGVDQEQLKDALTLFLMDEHGVAEPDFEIESQNDLIEAASEVSNTLSILLGSIAGISLLVGGIGVMNIMLVSVTERTHEIGIRRAVGARGSDIVQQFVAEALMLSLGGGLVGIALGIGASAVIDGREVAGQVMTTVVQPWSIVVAFAVAAGVGFVSGSYPAYRATQVDPIAALRDD
jgi:putative ABC transport system permease protein